MLTPILRPLSNDMVLRRRAEQVGEQLQQAVDALLTQLGQRGVHDQRSIQAALNLSQSAISRLVTSVRSGDPLATLSYIPGPEALQQMLKGASRSGVDRECLQGLEEAIAELRLFLDADVGDRGTLEAVLSDWVRESRASFELRHKAAAFKSMSAIRGVQADMVFNAGILYPSAHPDFHDCIGIDTLLGCRRIRPNGVLRLSGSHMAPAGARFSLTGLGGRPIESLHDMLLPEFSTVASDSIETRRHGPVLETTVRELPLGKGPERGADLVCVQVIRGLHRARRGDGRPTAGIAGQAEPPAEYYVVDALLHDEVWPGVRPEVGIFDTVVRGIAHPDDASRQGDRLDMLESVESLGHGPDAFRIAEFPRYPELVRRVCGELGWDAERLRGFRCRVRYPIYGAQIGLSFALPPGP